MHHTNRAFDMFELNLAAPGSRPQVSTMMNERSTMAICFDTTVNAGLKKRFKPRAMVSVVPKADGSPCSGLMSGLHLTFCADAKVVAEHMWVVLEPMLKACDDPDLPPEAQQAMRNVIKEVGTVAVASILALFNIWPASANELADLYKQVETFGAPPAPSSTQP